MRFRLFALLFSIFTIAISSCGDKCNCIVDKLTIANNDSLKNSIDINKIWRKFQLTNIDSGNVTEYRLAILPSYHCEERIYTLVIDPIEPYIVVNYFNKFEDDKFTDTLSRVIKIKLNKVKIEAFEEYIRSSCFWTLKSDGEPTLDGVTWLIEGHVTKQNVCNNRNSQIVWRKSEDLAFRNLCNEFLKLANTNYTEQDMFNSKCWKGE